jgi:hypothetical protein
MRILRTTPLSLLLVSLLASNTATFDLGYENGKAARYSLRISENKELLCNAPHVPEHRINIPELKSLAAPFKNETLSKAQHCPTKLTWQYKSKVTKTCYQQDKNPVIDKILRWCASM